MHFVTCMGECVCMCVLVRESVCVCVHLCECVLCASVCTRVGVGGGACFFVTGVRMCK